MNLQTRTKTTGRLARALVVGGLAVAAAGTMNGRDFMPGLATVAAQGPVLVVVAVPFAGRDGSAHVVYTGGSVVLHAVASIGGDGIPVTLTSGTWDPGDGSGPQVIVFTNSRALELTHTYTGGESTTFFATIAVSDGTTNATDTFKVQIVPRSLDAEVNMAVDRSLWYNHKRMTIGVITDASGSHPAGWWTDDDNNASTSAAVQAFEVNGHRESGDRLKNPYVDDASRGLRYLEAHVQRFTTTDLQGHAGTPEDPSPDTNSNGYALQTDAGDLVYVGGQIIDAFVASGTPDALVIAGTEAGRTYKDLAQDLLDAYSYGQNETGGGWVYTWNGQDGIDSSSSGWWGVGARAGDVWGLTIPAWVKTRNFALGIQGTLQSYDGTNTGSDGSCGYRAPNGNTAESGACLIMMAADGVSSTHARYVATENWLRRGWGIVNDTVDAHGNIYDMYNVTKAMRLAVDGTGASAPITHLGGDLDWYGADPAPATASSRANGFARYLVANQTSDGRLGQFGNWVTLSTANSWGTLILSTALFEQGPTAICQADAIVCSAGATCGAATVGAFSTANFDGTQSVAGDNAIASYKWDFKDPTSATPTSTDVTTTHVFDAVGTYPVTLTVKDTKGNASAAICSVVVSIAELPPLASAGPSAGYAMCLGRTDQVVLDGSASIARGADLVSYEWDIQAPTNFDAVGATGVTTNQTAYFTSLGVGSWPIKLRVTDNHTSPLVDEAGSTVTVRAADDAACNRPPVAVADSASTVSGTPAVISVLANDSDPDTWQVLTVSSTTTPTSGTVVVNVDQTVTYTPAGGFAGTATFNYTLSDGIGGTASALVTMTVTTPPAACTYSTSRNGVVLGRAGGTAVIAVATQFGCAWVASSGSAFLGVNPAAGTGSGNVTISVASNLLGAARLGYVTIAGQSVPVAQVGASALSRPPFDPNRDDRVDLLWQHQTNGLLGAWAMDGVRQISGSLLNPSQVSDTTWKVGGVGDLDGDGFGDLVWQNVVDGRVSVWLMNGLNVRDGSLLSIPQVDPLWRIKTVGDFNGDGRADIVWQHQSGAIAVWLMDGARVIFGSIVPSCVAPPMQLVGNGDFNADGNRDLVFQNPANGTVVVCFTNGLEPTSFQPIEPTPLVDLGWKVSGVGDFDRDGKPDLIWQHESNGSVGVWFMDGLRARSGSEVVAPGAMDSGWRIVGPK
jgi:PKD repeat protein